MPIEIEPLTRTFGARVTGVDVRRPLGTADAEALSRALAEHLVLVLPDQPMDDEQQIAFSGIFGPLETTGGANPAKGTVFARQSNMPTSRRSTRFLG